MSIPSKIKGWKVGKFVAIKEVAPYLSPDLRPVRQFKFNCGICNTHFIASRSNTLKRKWCSCEVEAKKLNYKRLNKIRSDHSLIYHPLRFNYNGMLHRCNNKTGLGYRNYGAKGIKVDKIWLGTNGLRNFVEWAEANGWEKGKKLQLDRINSKKGYGPKNCRYISATDNCRNRSSTVMVTYRKEKMALRTCIEKFGVDGLNLKLSVARYRTGWTLKEVLSGKRETVAEIKIKKSRYSPPRKKRTQPYGPLEVRDMAFPLKLLIETEPVISGNGRKIRRGNFECSCGKVFNTNFNSVRVGTTRSCGCLQSKITIERNIKNTKYVGIIPTIQSRHRNMISRCYDKANRAYKNYGGRGIKVCKEWRDKTNGMAAFNAWSINNGFNAEYDLDRIDNDKGYSPSNCRYVSRSDNCRNRRTSVTLSYKKKKYHLMDFIKKYNPSIDYSYALGMYRSNLPLEDIIKWKPMSK